MTVNEFFIDFRTDRNVGIPVLIQKTKQLCVKNVFAIPYYDIAKYISNALGSPDQPNIKSYSQKLKNVVANEDIQSLYSIEAVLNYHKKDVDKCKDYWVGWFNPYSRRFENITDIYGQAVLWTQKSADEAWQMYMEKYFKLEYQYFFSEEKLSGQYYGFSNENSLKLLGFPNKFEKDILKNEFFAFTKTFLDDSKITEAVLLNFIYEHISRTYSGYGVDPDVRFHRKQLVWNLFRDNSVLMFKELLRYFMVDNDTLLGDKIFERHFQNNCLNSKKGKYTEQLYRCLSMCVSFLSIGVDLKKRVDENRLMNISLKKDNGHIEDDFSIAIPSELTRATYQLVRERFDSSYADGFVCGFMVYLIKLFCSSKCLCCDSEIMGYYCMVDIGLKDDVKLEKYISI